MDLVIRATVIYFFVLFVLRITGKRTMAEITTFDMVLLLIIAEATDNSIIGEDHALTSTIIVITTFAVLELIMAFAKQKSPTMDRVLESTSLIIAHNGKLIKDRAEKEKVDEADILSEARRQHGITRMSHVKYAILEKSGGIIVVPK